MTRAARPRSGARCWAGAACFCATSALAAEPDVALSIDCPALDTEARAALESRARADLIVRHAEGLLSVSCRAGTGAVDWSPSRGRPLREQVPLPEGANVVERLLEATDRVLTPPQGPPVNSVSPGAPQGPAVPPPPAPFAADPATPFDRGTRASDPSASRGVYAPFAAAFGADLEQWGTFAALGPSLRGAWLASDRWSLVVGAAALFSLDSPLGVSGRLVRLRLGTDVAVDAERRLRLGAALAADFLRASPGSELNVETATDTSVALRLHAAYVVPVSDTVRLVTGPTATVRPSPVRVELGEREAFRIPRLALGLELELEVGP